MRWQDFRRSDNVDESSDSGSSGIGGIHLGVGHFWRGTCDQ
jgi:predicted metalloprotease